MKQNPKNSPRKRWRGWGAHAIWLTLGLLLAIWATAYFSAEARLRRATSRLVSDLAKAQAESPVTMGLAAHRLGESLLINAVVAHAEWGDVATGRSQIVQLVTQVRSAMDIIEIVNPRISSRVVRKGEIEIQVTLRYRMVATGQEIAGEGRAICLWSRSPDGWRLARVVLDLEDFKRPSFL